jgi:hypothetical protein
MINISRYKKKCRARRANTAVVCQIIIGSIFSTSAFYFSCAGVYTLFFIFILRLHNDAFTFYNVYICGREQKRERLVQEREEREGSSQYLHRLLLYVPFLKQGKK